MESLKAHLLLASPALADENFYRSVVLMISHDEEGALGVILNRPSEIGFAELWSKFTGNSCNSSIRIHRGGPVDGPPILLHSPSGRDVTDPGPMDSGEIELLAGVHLTTDEAGIEWLLNHPPQELKVICGYAGWGPGQLENELEHGGWLFMPATAAHVFSADEELWKIVAASIGRPVVLPDSFESDSDIDPSLN